MTEVNFGGQDIRTTAEHPFYVVGRGWVEAAFLKAGDVLVGHDGATTEVEGVDETRTIETVYNLRVADFHTLVGCQEWGFSVWVHNKDPKELARGFNARVTPWDKHAEQALPDMRFDRLTRRAREIVEHADHSEVLNLPRGGIPTSTLQEASMFLDRELAVVQGADGRLRLLIGEQDGIRQGLLRQGDRTLIHTHPTQVDPHIDHFAKDFRYKVRTDDHSVEAVLDWNGRVTFFNHEEIGLAQAISLILLGRR